jgi:hypothetical protein
MLELIAFVLFQIATFGSYSATAPWHGPNPNGYEASFNNLESNASICNDTINVRISGNGGWGHD